METGCLLALACGTWCHFWEADELLSHRLHLATSWRVGCVCLLTSVMLPLFGSLIDLKLIDEYQTEVRGKPDMPE